MQVFITGASGFVGGAAASWLRERGHTVTAMSRSKRSDGAIRATGATPIRCDLANVRASHLAGAEAVVHCAAFVEAWGPRDAWYKGNVLGTQAVLDAARSAGVRRFVHIGSEAALVHGQPLRGVDESYPLAPKSKYPYCATKAQAEQRVRAANVPAVFETIVLRPRFIWGPGDTTLLPTIEAMARAGRWMWIDHGRAVTSTTHIANLSRAIELALTEGRPGEAYFILDDGTRTLRTMIEGMAASRGLTLPNASLPSRVADAAGFACELVWRALRLRSDPPLTRHAALVMSRDCVLKGDKAKSELGYEPVITVEEGLAAMTAASRA
ncbi:MAG TPA: NAD-dependent epimerase/dehydratase family protein [Myxococcota bacterium]|nr:NAD-dependent epimerase/dehydratase family protein [Myxococcota bacterium]